MPKKEKSFLHGNKQTINKSWSDLQSNPNLIETADGIFEFLKKYEMFLTCKKGDIMETVDEYYSDTIKILKEKNNYRNKWGLKNNDENFLHDAIVGDMLGATGISKDDCGWDALFRKNGKVLGFIENKNIDINSQTWEGCFGEYNLYKLIELSSQLSIISLSLWKDLNDIALFGIIPPNKFSKINEAGKHLLNLYLKKATFPTDKFNNKINISAVLKFNGFFVSGPKFNKDETYNILIERHPRLKKQFLEKNYKTLYSFDEFITEVNLYENFKIDGITTY